MRRQLSDNNARDIENKSSIEKNQLLVECTRKLSILKTFTAISKYEM